MSGDYQSILTDQFNIPKMLFCRYKELGLDETEVLLLLQIYRFQEEGVLFPTPTEISAYMTINDQVCSSLLRKLIQMKLLTIHEEKNEQQVLTESYSLEPLWHKLYAATNKHDEPIRVSEDETNIFLLFEQEFGRPLSPFEIETINIWIDQEDQAPALIKAALREAVLLGKLNFKYIDRILREWKKKGIRSVQQAREQSRAFHVHQKHEPALHSDNKRDVSLYYNWLEEE
ncbi:DnaD domain-containing protein [Radiobacillus deserti]|uniref:DnaD domain-containing protein n=1 Tax=Radiobacillus deserti TaxID=2594883 RepID=A0A516KGC2_9BACI|nr:DnaD domain-containing protein [Radiobacillus deserti]QDP40429.1 DnaD domain-containing protein [Radiobacillus deserti]